MTDDIPTLSGPIVEPRSGQAPKQLVLFLHGVGADGNDLISLAPYFQRVLPDARFVSPNAPEPFDMAPPGVVGGYQWFSLQDMGPEARLAGAKRAAPVVDALIDREMAAAGVGPEDTALVGFSQGAMMALYCGLRRPDRLAGIVGYSGMLVGETTLADEIGSRPPVLLVHGDADEVMPFDAMGLAYAVLEANKVPVHQHRCPGLGHGIDDVGIGLAMGFLTQSAFGVDLESVAHDPRAHAPEDEDDGGPTRD